MYVLLVLSILVICDTNGFCITLLSFDVCVGCQLRLAWTGIQQELTSMYHVHNVTCLSSMCDWFV